MLFTWGVRQVCEKPFNGHMLTAGIKITRPN
jgi:hypothetical protein